VRLFLAIAPDRSVEAGIGQRMLQIQDALGDAASRLRWTPAGNVHATLHFLGEVAAGRITALRRAIEPPIPDAPFAIELGSVGAFPPAGPPRVLWLDITTGAEPMRSVHAELGRRLDAAGFAVEARPFSPHLTIARVPDRERAHVKSVRERLGDVPAASIAWTAARVVLFRSDLSGAVPSYEPLQEIALSGQ
jgi:2'-5' RNA ligase